nr:OB-fold domain-containing protein [Nocardia cerradoensis]
MLQPQRGGIPRPDPTPVSRPFWDGCVVGELRYQRCRTCGHAEFDPAWICRVCGGDDLDWQLSCGTGEVYSYTVVRRPQTPEFDSPYVVVIVSFDEGFSMLTNVIGCDLGDVHVGMRVRVCFHDIGEGVHLPYVEPVVKGNHGN